MKTYLIFLGLLIGIFSATAQKRNNIKVIGIGFDNSLTATPKINEIYESMNSLPNPFVFAHTFNWGGLGYERLLGTHVVVGASYWKYFDAESDEVTCYESNYDWVTNTYPKTVYYQPVAVPNSYFQNFTYKVTGFSLGFESKYYFKQHTENGANGVYLASSYQLTQVKHEFKEAIYADTTNGSSSSSVYWNKPFEPTTTYLNKVGLKLGVSGSSVMSADLFIGVNYIIPGNFSQFYESPLTNRAYNIQVGFNIGVPY